MSHPAPQPITLNLPHDVKITVPPFLGCMTTYVLLEQEDWFEDEVRFLRHALKPGMKMIDIGANLGVYSLSLAPIIGSEGHIWAVEPASMTAQFLRHSIDQNGFGQITLFQAGISDHDGVGFLHHDNNPEMHSLTPNAGANGRGEDVPLITLDTLVSQIGNPVIDLMKIDAEDHEPAIFQGGQQFLKTQAPLLMLEVIGHEKSLNQGLIENIQSFGFEIYRLVPGLNLLVPATAAEIQDIIPLNVFCLKPEAKAKWAHILADHPAPYAENSLDDRAETMLDGFWHSQSWSAVLAPQWQSWYRAALQSDTDISYARALGFWIYAQNNTLSANDRAGALGMAARLGASCANLNASISMTRILRDFGHRPACYEMAMNCGEFWSRNRAVDPTMPVLPLLPTDLTAAELDLDLWLNMSIIEQIDRFEAYSTMHRVERGRLLNDMLFQQRWHSLESERRLLLTSAVLNAKAPEQWPASERLRTQSANAHIWNGTGGQLWF